MKSTITAITIVSPGSISPPRQPSFVMPHAATIPIEMRSCGTASMTSAPRESSVSDQPPKKPADRGRRSSPISTAIPVATTPTSSDVRAPYIVRTNRSRPAASAPNQNCSFGPFGRPNSSVIGVRYGSLGGCPLIRSASGPPKIARKMSTQTTTPPPIAALSCLKRVQNICRGERLAAAHARKGDLGRGHAVTPATSALRHRHRGSINANRPGRQPRRSGGGTTLIPLVAIASHHGRFGLDTDPSAA